MTTLAEHVQLERAEEQANSSRVRAEVRWTERRVEQRGAPMRVVAVRMPASLYEALAKVGPPTTVARRILLAWANRATRPPSMLGP